MARMARVVAVGRPHHVTQRGNRRLPTFFRENDYRLYLDLMAEWCCKFGLEIWAYCLMTNHVHLVAVPEREESLARVMGEVHRRYTSLVNKREGWTGHLWQGRFGSFVMDESHLLAAARYIERNPVSAGMVAAPGGYEWSSARAHLAARDDALVKVAPLLSMMPDWESFLAEPDEKGFAEALGSHSRTGRPLGSQDFIEKLEQALGRRLRPGKPGPKKKRRKRDELSKLSPEFVLNSCR